MAQIFLPSADTIVRIALGAVVVVPLALFGYGLAIVRSPYTTEQKVILTQPVPFSHKHHAAELGIDCRYCHTSVETSSFAGIPPTATCMTCHSQLWTNAKMLAPVRESLATETPIHWQRVNRLPGYVYFDHSIHIAKGIGCTTCHGPVGDMPLMYQAKPLSMGWCLSCHRDPAMNLRTESEIFLLDWIPPKDQLQRGHALLGAYGIDVSHLTDCSVCHR